MASILLKGFSLLTFFGVTYVSVHLSKKKTYVSVRKQVVKEGEKEFKDCLKKNEAMLRLCCIDNEKIVDVDPRCSYESKYIRVLLEYALKDEDCPWLRNQHHAKPGDIGRFPYKCLIPSGILKVVNHYCVSRYEICQDYASDDHIRAQKLEDFDGKFIQKLDTKFLLHLAYAAYTLEIQSLLDLSHNQLGDLFGEKRTGFGVLGPA